MSQQETQSSRPVVVPDARVTQDISPAPTRTVGLGWATFAGVLFMVAGFWNFFAGWVALVRKEYFSEASLLYHDLQVVGWVWLGLGVIQVLASYLIFARKVSGQVLGVVLASLSMLVWFFTIGAYPMWAMMIVALNALIIYGLTATARSTGRAFDRSVFPDPLGSGKTCSLSQEVVERALGFVRLGQEIVDRLSRSFLRSLQHVIERRPLEISGGGHELVEVPTRVAFQADPERSQDRGMRLRQPRRHLDLGQGLLGARQESLVIPALAVVRAVVAMSDSVPQRLQWGRQ